MFDGSIWFAAICVATWLRFDFEYSTTPGTATLLLAVAAGLGHLLLGSVIVPCAVGHQRGSFEETTNLVGTMLVTSIVLLAWTLLAPALLADPQMILDSIPVVAGALALVGMFEIRFLVRSWRSRHHVSREDARRVIVFGAGDAGRRLLRSMTQDEASCVLGKRSARTPSP